MCWPLDLWNSIPVAFVRRTFFPPGCRERRKKETESEESRQSVSKQNARTGSGASVRGPARRGRARGGEERAGTSQTTFFTPAEATRSAADLIISPPQHRCFHHRLQACKICRSPFINPAGAFGKKTFEGEGASGDPPTRSRSRDSLSDARAPGPRPVF